MRRVSAITAAAALGLTFAVTPASAGTLSASCQDESHYLNATQNYGAPNSTYHHWFKYQFEITGKGTDGESNVIIVLREDGVQRYGQEYRSVNQNQTYNGGMGGVSTRQSSAEYVLFRGIFDEFGPDPACNGYTDTI